MKHSALIRGLVALMCLIFPLTAFAAGNVSVQVVVNNPGDNPGVQPVGPNGAVDWDQNVVQAKGIGVPPATVSHPAQMRVMARRAAIVDAQRNLAEVIQGVQVNSETTVQNNIVLDDFVKSKVTALIQGARIIQEQPMPDGSYEVVLMVKLVGNNSVASAIAPSTASQPQALPQPSATYNGTTLPSYTGVVIDARGLRVEPSMQPRIFDQLGRNVYGNQYVDQEEMIAKGLADYGFTQEDYEQAKNGQSRAGALPLIIKATSTEFHHKDIIISNEDADKILAANSTAGFLQKCNVVIIK